MKASEIMFQQVRDVSPDAVLRIPLRFDEIFGVQTIITTALTVQKRILSNCYASPIFVRLVFT